MLCDKNLVLFFTFGMSLKKWSEGGMLFREIKLYNELANHFDKIYFLTYGGEEEKEYKNFLASNIEILYNKSGINPFIYSFLAPFIHRDKLKESDIYKTNQMSGSWTAVIAKLLFKKKLILRQGYQFSSTLKKKGKNLLSFVASILEFFSYKLADGIIVTAQSIKDFIEEKYKIEQGKVAVIPNYVDTESFKQINNEKEKGRIIFVGRFGEEKNLFALIDAVKGLDGKLVLIGKGPLENALKKKAKAKGILNVVFSGVVPNERLPEELNKSEIFILPSLYEGNPKTLLEAMACGLPVIGTSTVGIKEVIKHGVNGYLCETSAEAIRKAIIYLMNDHNLRRKLAMNARRTIIENYSLEKLAERELKLYDRLLGG